jgi:hypothetical protein
MLIIVELHKSWFCYKYNVSCKNVGKLLVCYLKKLSNTDIFEIRVLRRILGPKRNEVRGDWRQLHNEELYDLYCHRILFA